MAEKSWCVYIHSLPNGGSYIGQTCDISTRWRPSAYKNCVKFYAAIQKYGWDSFSHQILFDNLTLEEANILEEEMIKKYNTIETGFNLQSGGENKLHSQETKNKMSETRKGVPHSPEHRAAISKALTGKRKHLKQSEIISLLSIENQLNVLKQVFNTKVFQMQKDRLEFQEKLLVAAVEENRKQQVVIIGGF